MAASTLISPAPWRATGSNTPVSSEPDQASGVAVERSRQATASVGPVPSDSRISGCACMISAVAPARYGADMEVPEEER